MSVFFTDKKVVDYDTALSSDTEKMPNTLDIC